MADIKLPNCRAPWRQGLCSAMILHKIRSLRSLVRAISKPPTTLGADARANTNRIDAQLPVTLWHLEDATCTPASHHGARRPTFGGVCHLEPSEFMCCLTCTQLTGGGYLKKGFVLGRVYGPLKSGVVREYRAESTRYGHSGTVAVAILPALRSPSKKYAMPPETWLSLERSGTSGGACYRTRVRQRLPGASFDARWQMLPLRAHLPNRRAIRQSHAQGLFAQSAVRRPIATGCAGEISGS